MPLEVLWTQPARDDLRALEDYIAADRPRAAAAYRLRIIERCEALADFPNVGQVVSAEIGLRILAYETVTILYQVSAGIVVLRVLAAGRDVDAAVRALGS